MNAMAKNKTGTTVQPAQRDSHDHHDQGIALVVMGVSGCGKSTIAEKIAAALHWPMVEGDDLHPAANIAKMKRHQPLNDADRQPWLAAIGKQVDRWQAQGSSGIITCSALKRRYRDGLVAGGEGESARPQLRFVYLKGSKELIRERLSHRAGHFMPPDLLDSQFADLEEPAADEPAISVDIDATPEAIAAEIIERLGLRAASTAAATPARRD
jgi:carbohydrate kinase (thermoresistant glucokinase family)